MTKIYWRSRDIGGSPSLIPDPEANFAGVRLGMAMTPFTNGAPGFTYSIVGRQSGERVWRLDFHEERDCEAEMEIIRGLFEAWSEGRPREGFPTAAYRVSNFEPETGQIVLSEEMAPVRQPLGEGHGGPSHSPTPVGGVRCAAVSQ